MNAAQNHLKEEETAHAGVVYISALIQLQGVYFFIRDILFFY